MELLILGRTNDFGLKPFPDLASDMVEALLKPGIDWPSINFLNVPAIIQAWAKFRFPLKMIARVHLEVSFLAFLKFPFIDRRFNAQRITFGSSQSSTIEKLLRVNHDKFFDNFSGQQPPSIRAILTPITPSA